MTRRTKFRLTLAGEVVLLALLMLLGGILGFSTGHIAYDPTTNSYTELVD